MKHFLKIHDLPIASGVSTFGCIGAEVAAELGCKVLEWVVNRPLLLALLLFAELAAAAWAAWAAWALLEPLEFLRCVNELMMEVERMGLRKGCIFTLEAAMIRIDAANIWDVVPTVSYFFSLTCKIHFYYFFLKQSVFKFFFRHLILVKSFVFIFFDL